MVIVFGSVCNNRRNSGDSRQNDINRCKIFDFGVYIEYNNLRSDVYNGLKDDRNSKCVDRNDYSTLKHQQRVDNLESKMMTTVDIARTI